MPWRALSPTLLARELDPAYSIPPNRLADNFARFLPRPIGFRISAWARYFLTHCDTEYVFGDAPTGYVTEGRLVNDHRLDCFLFTCRLVELATARQPEDALYEAARRRFPGVPPEEIAGADGRIRYEHPGRLRYAWDLIQSGGFGTDITSRIGGTAPDPGTPRYPTGTVRYAPTAGVSYDSLTLGDLVFFVLDEANEHARKARDETGAFIGHIGVIAPAEAAVIADDPVLVHAASSDLPGVYRGGRVVEVTLREYLSRVERFKGIVVTRLTDI